MGLSDYSRHFGAASFVNYQFEGSDFSLGGWFEYFTSNGAQTWFLNSDAQGVGLVTGPTWSPSWAKKHLFVRGEVGVLHLITVGAPGSAGYGGSGTGCQSEVSNCLPKCDRASHREEAIHACHQECQSNYVSCRTDAQCK